MIHDQPKIIVVPAQQYVAIWFGLMTDLINPFIQMSYETRFIATFQ